MSVDVHFLLYTALYRHFPGYIYINVVGNIYSKFYVHLNSEFVKSLKYGVSIPRVPTFQVL